MKTLNFYVDSIDRKALIYRFLNDNKDETFFSIKPKKDSQYELELVKIGPSNKAILTVDFSFDNYCLAAPIYMHPSDLALLKTVLDDGVILRAFHLMMESFYKDVRKLPKTIDDDEVNDYLFKDPNSKLFLLDLVDIKQISSIKDLPRSEFADPDNFVMMCNMVVYSHLPKQALILFTELFKQDVSKVELT